MIAYQGVFFDEETSNFIRSLEKDKLPISVRNLHCAFKISPSDEEVFDNIVGEEIEILLKGYGSNEKASAFEVEIPTDVKEYYNDYDYELEKLKKPHIITSLAKSVSPVDPDKINFEPLPEQYIVKGRLGYYISGRSSSFVSFEPQINIPKVRERV